MMKLFFSISFLCHLAFFSMASILSSNFKTDSLPILHVEVTLYPWMTEEKQVKGSIKKGEKEIFPLPPPEVEVREHPLSETPPLPLEDKKGEIRDQEEQVEKKPFVLASLNPETVLTIQREGPPEPLPSPSRSPSVEEEAKQVAKYPSLSEGEVILIHPKYAENPRPRYPREARKKGFQGEVVLKVEVLPSGLVGQVEVKKSSGHEILDRSALSAVKQWKFFPAKRGENAIASWVNIPIIFRLQ
jgi:protein TonB